MTYQAAETSVEFIPGAIGAALVVGVVGTTTAPISAVAFAAVGITGVVFLTEEYLVEPLWEKFEQTTKPLVEQLFGCEVANQIPVPAPTHTTHRYPVQPIVNLVSSAPYSPALSAQTAEKVTPRISINSTQSGDSLVLDYRGMSSECVNQSWQQFLKTGMLRIDENSSFQITSSVGPNSYEMKGQYNRTVGLDTTAGAGILVGISGGKFFWGGTVGFTVLLESAAVVALMGAALVGAAAYGVYELCQSRKIKPLEWLPKHDPDSLEFTKQLIRLNTEGFDAVGASTLQLSTRLGDRHGKDSPQLAEQLKVMTYSIKQKNLFRVNECKDNNFSVSQKEYYRGLRAGWHEFNTHYSSARFESAQSVSQYFAENYPREPVTQDMSAMLEPNRLHKTSIALLHEGHPSLSKKFHVEAVTRAAANLSQQNQFRNELADDLYQHGDLTGAQEINEASVTSFLNKQLSEEEAAVNRTSQCLQLKIKTTIAENIEVKTVAAILARFKEYDQIGAWQKAHHILAEGSKQLPKNEFLKKEKIKYEQTVLTRVECAVSLLCMGIQGIVRLMLNNENCSEQTRQQAIHFSNIVHVLGSLSHCALRDWQHSLHRKLYPSSYNGHYSKSVGTVISALSALFQVASVAAQYVPLWENAGEHLYKAGIAVEGGVLAFQAFDLYRAWQANGMTPDVSAGINLLGMGSIIFVGACANQYFMNRRAQGNAPLSPHGIFFENLSWVIGNPVSQIVYFVALSNAAITSLGIFALPYSIVASSTLLHLGYAGATIASVASGALEVIQDGASISSLAAYIPPIPEPTALTVAVVVVGVAVASYAAKSAYDNWFWYPNAISDIEKRLQVNNVSGAQEILKIALPSFPTDVKTLYLKDQADVCQWLATTGKEEAAAISNAWTTCEKRLKMNSNDPIFRVQSTQVLMKWVFSLMQGPTRDLGQERQIFINIVAAARKAWAQNNNDLAAIQQLAIALPYLGQLQEAVKFWFAFKTGLDNNIRQIGPNEPDRTEKIALLIQAKQSADDNINNIQSRISYDQDLATIYQYIATNGPNEATAISQGLALCAARLRLDSNDPIINSSKIDLLLKQASCLMKAPGQDSARAQQLLAEVETLARSAIAKDHNNLAAMQHLATVLQCHGKLAEAEKQWADCQDGIEQTIKQLRQVDPSGAIYAEKIVQLTQLKENIGKNINTIREEISYEQDQSTVYKIIENNGADTKEVARGIMVCTARLARNSEDIAFKILKAELLLKDIQSRSQDNPSEHELLFVEMEALARSVLKSDKDNLAAMRQLAIALQGRGHLQDAIHHWKAYKTILEQHILHIASNEPRNTEKRNKLEQEKDAVDKTINAISGNTDKRFSALASYGKNLLSGYLSVKKEIGQQLEKMTRIIDSYTNLSGVLLSTNRYDCMRKSAEKEGSKFFYPSFEVCAAKIDEVAQKDIQEMETAVAHAKKQLPEITLTLENLETLDAGKALLAQRISEERKVFAQQQLEELENLLAQMEASLLSVEEKKQLQEKASMTVATLAAFLEKEPTFRENIECQKRTIKSDLLAIVKRNLMVLTVQAGVEISGAVFGQICEAFRDILINNKRSEMERKYAAAPNWTSALFVKRDNTSGICSGIKKKSSTTSLLNFISNEKAEKHKKKQSINFWQQKSAVPHVKVASSSLTL